MKLLKIVKRKTGKNLRRSSGENELKYFTTLVCAHVNTKHARYTNSKKCIVSISNKRIY